ncbi:UV-stimulated scaffold protein A isoform X1 [Carex littledalei]|uniref:UV-stimulated scaffold protein A isoform X1 n=1 Tax=Carex littledalei TaxID=544730 RepID=A0A833VK68_9POAL|nr:UV-stimulated scaffold protein A isoform X1 [Carex littledalei]
MASEEGLENETGIVVWRLIERASDSTEPDVDPRLLKAIKSAVRSSDVETRAAVRSLMELMKKPHSQVRYLSLLIIDELFMRSKLFRSIFVETLEQFLALSIGFRKNMPLPPPSAIASNLRKKSIEFLEKWNSNFGIHYPQLRLGFNYLKNVLKFQFPNNLENAARLQRERRERELKTQEILLGKYENLKENFSSIKGEIRSTLDEINECLDIISVKKEELNPAIDFTLIDDEMEAFSSLEMRQIRMDSMKEAKTVHETQDNEAVFDSLRELHKLLVSKHLVSVQEWISVLIRVDLADNRFRDTALRELIDLRNNIQSVKDKLVEMGYLFDKVNKVELEEAEDIWEEGKIENLPQGLVQRKGKNVASTSSSSIESLNSRSKSKNIKLDPERSKLLAEAPVINWGLSLDNWGSSSDAIANQRGLEIEGHWGRVDNDRIIPQEKIAELSVHRMVYKEEPVEISPCLAPLKNGALCQRRDLKFCPFHGPIVPRDSEGNPIENCNEATTKKTEECVDRETMEGLVKQAVNNVRNRERDEREIKRAKLARVREHNQEVLRESAMASTSYSEDLVQSRGEFKTKKPTLASMLKKKVTAKDRIAKKLL